MRNIVLLSAALLAACASTPPAASPSTTAAKDPNVIVHSAGDQGFRANAYLVETEHGVVAVDAPFTVSESKAFRAKLDALHKPLLAVLVTHAHPDHVNGIGELVRGAPKAVPIYALDGVSKTLAEIDGPKRAYWTPIYKEEYPAKTTFPDHTVKDGDVVAIDGVTFTVHDLGAGESADEAIWVMQGATKRAFVGDLVMHRVHPWLAEGRSAQWIASLAKAKTIVAGATSVYPGHGSVTDPSALDWQARYLEAYRGAVKAIANGKPALDDAQKKELTARMKEVLPDGGLEALVAMSADSVAAELQKGH